MRNVLYYQDGKTREIIASVWSDRGMGIDDILAVSGVDLDQWAADKGWDGWDIDSLVTAVEPDEVKVADLIHDGSRFILVDKASGDVVLAAPDVGTSDEGVDWTLVEAQAQHLGYTIF